MVKRRSLSAFRPIVKDVDRIIAYLKLRFIAEKPPQSRVAIEVALMTAEENGDYF